MNDHLESKIIDLCIGCRKQARGVSRSAKPRDCSFGKLSNIARQPAVAITRVLRLDLAYFEFQSGSASFNQSSLRRIITKLVAILLLFSAPVTYTADLAVGYSDLSYQLPTPGSYQLARISEAVDGQVIDVSGELTTLHTLFDGRLSLMSFMYSSCDDVNGCPLSSYVFYKIKSAMSADPQLAERLQLISLSFDPEVDVPEVMRLYANNFRFAGDRGEWRFITTSSISVLTPILRAYDQDIQRQQIVVENDTQTEISHLLKVFLIDQRKNIRNIYSVSYLHPDVLINDVRTLIAETEGNDQIDIVQISSLSRPGDSKIGYESPDYQTDSLSLIERQGKATNLVALAHTKVAGLPAVPEPAHNPLTPEKVSLGRKLFFDRRLSINETFSCAMCHVPEQGFTSNEMSTALGVEGRSVKRNTPTLYNVGYFDRLFHDGREENLEQQVWSPLLARNEMANPSVGYVLGKIRHLADYDGLFEKAFAGKEVGMETLGMALASYQRTLVAGNSPFDRWLYERDQEAITEQARNGFNLFTGKGSCNACHHVGDKYALFTDSQLHNTGLGYRNSILDRPTAKTITLAPGVFIEVDPKMIAEVGEKPPADIGQYEVTEDPADRWKYRTPTLRNVSLTSPYMHNGQFTTLREVLEFYNKGGEPHELQNPLIRPLGLTDSEIDDLVAFLMSLTSDNIDILVSDAFAAPIGDPIGQSGGN